mmetsp:Transcript_19317/g.42101  ORF Transcript_19317/g.42101 Transcript_19317/m.42101 type:complete len:616 (+) Transcript_19317:75-1922(+)
MDMDKLLDKLCVSAGAAEEEVLSLLLKLFGNIADNPAEQKFRRLSPENAKLQAGLFQHVGSGKFLHAAGFVKGEDGNFELPQSAGSAFIEARAALIRRHGLVRERKQREETAGGAARMVEAYTAAVKGGVHGAGHDHLDEICKQTGGHEVLELLERILLNVRRYPTSERYKSVNLSKSAGQKVAVTIPLLQLAGFERAKLESGEECMRVTRPNLDLLERVWAMVWWRVHWKASPPLELKPSSPMSSRALGALLGFAVGDALGAPLGERDAFGVTSEELDKVMEMSGGGMWSVAPGQVTGHTELLVCLSEGLATDCTGTSLEFPADDMACRYGRWGQSRPFASDRACVQAFSGPMPAKEMEDRAAKSNSNALGSGTLARCLPFAALGAARGEPTAFASWAQADARLSHPSWSVGDATAAYTVTAGHLIAGDDARTSLTKLQEWAAVQSSALAPGASRSEVEKAHPAGWTKLTGDTLEAHGNEPGKLIAFQELVALLNKALADDKVLPFATGRGDTCSAEVAVTHAFRHLKLGSSFEVAMRSTLAGAGDARANAAVVGGLVGAAVGLEGIPERWIRAVMTCDTASGQVRPPEYHPKQIPALLQRFSTPSASRAPGAA